MEKKQSTYFQRYLNTLTILTFMGAGIGLVFSILYIIFWNNMGEFIAKNDASALGLKEAIIKVIGIKEWNNLEANGLLEKYYLSMRNYYLVAAFCHFFAIVAVIAMRKRIANAFFLYIFSHVLFILAPYLTVYRFYPTLGETFMFTAFSGLFIYLYARVYKEIK